MRIVAVAIGLVLVSTGLALAAAPATAPAASPEAIALPGGEGGIGFDDLGYSRTLGKVLAPGGRTGKLYLVDPSTGAVTSIAGFSTAKEFSGGHDDGITSVAEGAGLLFVTDRTREQGGVHVLDMGTGKIVGNATVGAGVDIISYSPDLGHLYVPSSETKMLAVLGVSPAGALSLLGTFPGTEDSHCVAAADKVYYCDPARGSLLAVSDPYPPSAR